MSAVAHHQSHDADRRFIRRAMHAPLLSAERERMLAGAWRREGDEAALHELINAYTRLVVAVAGRYRHYGLPLSDLVQEGVVGLMQAAGRFDPEREVRFSTYAGWWVRAGIQDFILRNWSIVRTGTTAAQKTLFFNLRRLRAQIGDTVDGPLGPDGRRRIAQGLGIREVDVERMDLRLSGADQSLNRPIGEAGEHEWQDVLADERATPEQAVLEMRDARTRARWLESALQGLTPRERMIIAERRLAEDGVTLESLGQVLGISKERVRQIEHQALTKMRVQIARDAGLEPGQPMEF
ncbi:MAG: RNA polymerase factor sigma-32 [Sneathiellaceae bacterium]